MMKVCPVYNLVFPPWCRELTIFGYRFSRVDDYEKSYYKLQHLVSVMAEFSEVDSEPKTGTHSLTSFAEIPKHEEKAVFDWEGKDKTALQDILLLLSIFTGRDVFALAEQYTKKSVLSDGVIIADPRVYSHGGILRMSIPYKKQPIEPEPFSYNIGFEIGLNQIYELIRNDEWQNEYRGGYFLILARTAFRRQSLESSFIQCWTIWEHLFSIHNDNWLSDKQIATMSSAEKISFLMVKYALTGKIDNKSRVRIEGLSRTRNRLIHFGRFPDEDTVREDALLFIHLTEFIIAKTLHLSPSNGFNTVEKLENYLNNLQKPKKGKRGQPTQGG